MKPAEREAFIDAYCQHGDAPVSHVRQFLERFESNQDVPFDEYYTGIADALSMWHLAINFQLKQLSKG
jgi:hypothetical protein